MKTAGKFSIAAMVVFGLLAAPVMAGQSPPQRDAANLARFQRFASPPQDSMHYWDIDRFQYLGPDAKGNDALALWTGVNQVYLITVDSPCLRLEYANAIALTSISRNVNARMDYVKYGRGNRCRITTIQKVDYKAMLAEDKANAGAGG